MRSDLPLYLGGEDAFCRRVACGPGGAISPFGTLDRKELAAARLRLIVSETPK
jgi:7,8-dihydropterin-6-yl-methyl-4-(beta-D-ribofuranosyl)aminobenzene 5'-phosphate synthase